jgi:hypothetical protein
VRGNEEMGLDGAKALTDFLFASKSGKYTNLPHSLCGVTPSNSTIEVPSTLQDVDLRLVCAGSRAAIELGPLSRRAAALLTFRVRPSVCAELSSHIFAEGIAAGMGGKQKKTTVLNRRGAAAANEWFAFIWAVKENR